ncbi:MAG TPA: ADOP family duplicated permease [Gemmatimonadaceae bacterium]|nr:ADOP family duplicated permease [Gemmatimonadaceae bacterium]
MSNLKPPIFAEWLARRAAPRHDADFVVGDLREAFDERLASSGADEARRWYWGEALRSAAPLFARRLTSSGRPHHTTRNEDPMWTPFFGDARHALRLAARTPLASFAVVATMVLGIGSTTAVFSAMNAIVLKPLPFPESSRVVQLNSTLPDGRVSESLAYPDLMDFRRTVSDFIDLTVFQTSEQTLQSGAEPRLVRTVEVDDRYPRVFGTRVALGRWLAPSDLVVNAPKVVLLSNDFWVREFGGDHTIVGRTITLDNESVQVIGVLAAGAYTYPVPAADALRPLIIVPNTPMTNRGSLWASAAARLRPEASIAQAGRRVTAAANFISKEFPASNTKISARITPLREAVVGSVQSMLKLLAAAVAAVLLIACVNIANLILGRAQTRAREFAVRSAIGGSPGRVRGQVFTENLVLAAIGGVLGVALAPLLTHALIAVYPDALPRADEITVDGRVLVVAALATLIAGTLSALPTARRAGRLDLVRDLREGGRSGGGRGDRRAGRVLIVTQVAASLALLFGAGLLLQTFWRLTQVGPGFNARNTMTFHLYAPTARYSSPATVTRYYDDATNALRGIPGVSDVSTGTLVPFAGGRFHDTYIQKELGDQGTRNPQAAIALVGPAYEHALGLPVTRGRTFAISDDSASEPVVVINETLAKRYYPGVDPIGRVVDWNFKSWRIVGVVAATHLDNLWDEPEPVLYATPRQVPRRGRYFIMRSNRPANQVLVAARAALHQIDPTIALTDPASMQQRVDASLGGQRFRAALMATLGALALILAVLGIYGVVAHAVTRRTREIGIRMALGEAAHEVRRRVVGDALRVASVGIVAGLGLALVAGRSLSGFLIAVSPSDPRMLAAAAVLLIGVVTAAAYGPARRASRVDPVEALRGE